MAYFDQSRIVCDLLFHGSLASIYILSMVEETSPVMEARYEKYGFTGYRTFGGRFKYATMINLVILNPKQFITPSISKKSFI